MSALPYDAGRRPAEALRWGAAACLVAGLHIGAGWWLLHRDLLLPPPEGATGIVIDLEPVAVPTTPPAASQPLALAGAAPAPAVSEAPEAQPAPPLPGPPPAAEEPAPAPAVPPEAPSGAQPPAVTAPPDPAPAPAEPAPPEPVTHPEPVVRALDSTAPAEALVPPVPPERTVSKTPAPARPKVAPARPKPPVPRLEAVRPDPRQVAREAARRQARSEARAQARSARVAALRQGGGPATEAAAAQPVASGAEVASWRGAVVAHLNAYKPASPNGADGTVRVAFSVDRGGRVVSAAVAGSSGDPSLDQAAVAMVRRASPVPAPPPELGGRIALAVPVRFH